MFSFVKKSVATALLLGSNLLTPGLALAATAPGDTVKTGFAKFMQGKEVGLFYTGSFVMPFGAERTSSVNGASSLVTEAGLGRDFSVYMRWPLGESWNLRTSLGVGRYRMRVDEYFTDASASNTSHYIEGELRSWAVRPSALFEYTNYEGNTTNRYWVMGLEFPFSAATYFGLDRNGENTRNITPLSSDAQIKLPSKTVAALWTEVRLGRGLNIGLSQRVRLNLEFGVTYDLSTRWKQMTLMQYAVREAPTIESFSQTRCFNLYLSAGLGYHFAAKRKKSKVSFGESSPSRSASGYYEYRRPTPTETPKPGFGDEAGNKALANLDTLYLPAVARPKSSLSKELKINHGIEGTVAISTPDGHGSGFLISADGYIVTNEHVVDTFSTVKVKLYNNLILEGKVVRKNPMYDLALIKISGAGFKPLAIGNADSVLTGSDVFVIGAPFDTELSSTVTKGILSAKRTHKDIKLIQTDAAISGGNSGGPLLSDAGLVVGVAHSKVKMTGVEGLGFCVAADQVFEGLKIKIRKR